MPGTNKRGHTIPLGTETSVTRATIFEVFGNSINDIVAVANTVARAQLVTDLTAVGEAPSTTNPLFVYRADAAWYRAVEFTVDGTNWFAASGYYETALGSVVPTAGAGYTLSNNNLYVRNGLLLGSIDFAKTAGTVAHGDTILTLPVGARPTTDSAVATVMSPSPAVFQDVAVSTTGAVTPLSPAAGRTGGSVRFNPGLAIPYV